MYIPRHVRMTFSMQNSGRVVQSGVRRGRQKRRVRGAEVRLLRGLFSTDVW